MQEIAGSPRTRDYFCWLILHGTVLVAWRAGFARGFWPPAAFLAVFSLLMLARVTAADFSVFSLLLPCAPTAAAFFLFQFSSIKRLVRLAFATL
jgi:hypothetical protein